MWNDKRTFQENANEIHQSFLGGGIVLGLSAQVTAEEVYVDRTRFEGLIRGSGPELMVDLKQFAELLKLKPEEADGGIYLGRSGFTAGRPESGTVSLEGHNVKCSDDEGKIMVNLKEASQALGLRYKVAGQRVDIFFPAGWATTLNRLRRPRPEGFRASSTRASRIGPGEKRRPVRGVGHRVAIVHVLVESDS